MGKKAKIAFIIIGIALILGFLLVYFEPKEKSIVNQYNVNGAEISVSDKAILDWLNFDNSTRTIVVINPNNGNFLGSLKKITPTEAHFNQPTVLEAFEINLSKNMSFPISKIYLFAKRNGLFQDAVDREQWWRWWNPNAQRTEYNQSCIVNNTAPFNQSCSWIAYNVSGDWKPIPNIDNIQAGKYTIGHFIVMQEGETLQYQTTITIPINATFSVNITVVDWGSQL